jgi:hypothetical protein
MEDKVETAVEVTPEYFLRDLENLSEISDILNSTGFSDK